jgi:hypothetical protein
MRPARNACADALSASVNASNAGVRIVSPLVTAYTTASLCAPTPWNAAARRALDASAIDPRGGRMMADCAARTHARRTQAARAVRQRV